MIADGVVALARVAFKLVRVGDELAGDGVVGVRGVDEGCHRRGHGHCVALLHALDLACVVGRNEACIGEVGCAFQGLAERGHGLSLSPSPPRRGRGRFLPWVRKIGRLAC